MEPFNTERRRARASVKASAVAALIWCAMAPLLTAQTPAAPANGPEHAATTKQPAGPEPGQYWYDQAQLHQRYEMTEEAEKCYAKAVATAKGTQIKVQAYDSWGDLLERQKQNADAAAKFYQAQALADNPERKWRLLQRCAGNSEAAGKNDDASAQYQLLMKTGPQPGEREWARDRLCDLYRRLEKKEELYRVFESMAALDPKDTLALQTLVMLYRDWKGDLVAARTAAMKLLLIKPEDAQVILQLADIDVRLKNTDQAVALYYKLIGLQPAQRANCYNGIANAYFQASQPEKGLEWTEKAANVDPQTMDMWLRYGDVCYWNGQAARALPAYTNAHNFAKNEGDHDQVKLREANAYRELKRDAEAMALYKELGAKPKSPVRDQAKRELIELYARRGLLDKVKIELVEPPAAPTPATTTP